MTKITKFSLTLALTLALSAVGGANTPGSHVVQLAWVQGSCSAPGACTTNIYRGTAAGVCANGKTPYATGVVGATYTDQNPPTGAVFYNVTQVDTGRGGESTCNGEVQQTVPPVTTQPDTALAATVQ